MTSILFGSAVLAFAVFFVSETMAIRWANSDDVLYDSLYHGKDFWRQSWEMGIQQARFYMPVAFAPIAVFFSIENPILLGLARCGLVLGQLAAMSWLVFRVVGSRAQGLRFFLLALLLLQVPLTYNSILSYPEIGLGFIFFALSSARLLNTTSVNGFTGGASVVGFVLACCMNEAFWLPSAAVAFFSIYRRTSSRPIAWVVSSALALYLVVYIVFRLTHPTQYQGTHLSFDIGAFILTAARNVIATFPGVELVIDRYNFEPADLLKNSAEIGSILRGASVCMVITISCGLAALAHPRLRQRRVFERTDCFDIIFPAAVAFAFIAPFCATQKYQSWAHTRQYPYVYALYAWMFVVLIGMQFWERLKTRLEFAKTRNVLRVATFLILCAASWAVFASNRHVFRVLRLCPYPVKGAIVRGLREGNIPDK